MLKRTKTSYSELVMAIEEFAKKNFSALALDKYLRKENTRRFCNLDSNQKEYPKTIKIAASIDEMFQKGEPFAVQEVTIKEPLVFKDIPVWYDNSGKTINLSLGNRDGDSAKGCSLKMGESKPENNEAVHYMMGGTTGMGKSVTLNGLISGLTTEYAPWEIRIVLSDAKIVEFTKWSKKPLPHISAIAATGDTNYLVSILKYFWKQMQRANTVFGYVSASKIEDFRKITGLAMPRTVIIMDEFTSMVKQASSEQLKEINFYLQEFAIKGRNTGFHLLPCSQNLEDLNADIARQIKGRIILGCDKKTSNMMVGNDGGVEIMQPGKAIANMVFEKDNNKPDNQHYQVPFMADEPFIAFREEFADWGYNVGYRQPFSMYSEEKYVREKDYDDYISKAKNFTRDIILGEPSVMAGGYSVDIKLDTEADSGGIVICDSDIKEVTRYVGMLYHNIKNIKSASYVFAGSNSYVKDVPQLVNLAVNKNKKGNLSRFKSVEDNKFIPVINGLIIRKFRLEVDSEIFDNEIVFKETELSEKVINSMLEHGLSTNLNNETLSELEKNRIRGYLTLASSSPLFRTVCPVPVNSTFKKQEITIEVINKLSNILLGITRMNRTLCRDKQLMSNDFSTIFVWILGLDKIIGFGVKGDTDYTSSFCKKYRALIMEAHNYNYNFIFATKSTANCDNLLQVCAYGITTHPRMENGFKLIFGNTKSKFPEYDLSPVLGVLVDNSNIEVTNFKKMIGDKESVG